MSCKIWTCDPWREWVNKLLKRSKCEAVENTHRIEIGNDFIEEAQTFEALVVDRLLRVELCEDKNNTERVKDRLR